MTNVKTDWHDDAGAPVTRSYVCPTDEQRHEWLGPEIPSFLALAERQELGGKLTGRFQAEEGDGGRLVHPTEAAATANKTAIQARGSST